MTFQETILDELLRIFKKDGIDAYTEEDLLKKLDIRASTFHELFPDKAGMVKKVIQYNNELQKQEHEKLLSTAKSPVEEIILLLKDGIRDIQTISPQYVSDLQLKYPDAWGVAVEHLNAYSYHQLFDIINRGIVDGYFRKDINIQLVVKIVLEQIYLIINPIAFPPDKFELGEVFRSIYLYYIRGLCTDKGMKVLDTFFSSTKF